MERVATMDADSGHGALVAGLDPAPYELDPDVNACLRSAIMAGAAEIDALAVSFHPRRGNLGLRRDLERARRILKSAYGDVQRALAVLNRGEDRTRH